METSKKNKKFNGGIWRKETRSEVRQNELFVVVYLKKQSVAVDLKPAFVREASTEENKEMTL